MVKGSQGLVYRPDVMHKVRKLEVLEGFTSQGRVDRSEIKR